MRNFCSDLGVHFKRCQERNWPFSNMCYREWHHYEHCLQDDFRLRMRSLNVNGDFRHVRPGLRRRQHVRHIKLDLKKWTKIERGHVMWCGILSHRSEKNKTIQCK